MQAGRSQFAIQTRPPLPSDSGLSYSKLFLDALTISVNPANKLNNLPLAQREGHLHRQGHGVERLPRVGAERADLGLRPQLDRGPVHVLHSARSSAARPRARTSRRWTRTARSPSRSPRTRTASATSAWPTRVRAAASSGSRSTAWPPRPRRSSRSSTRSRGTRGSCCRRRSPNKKVLKFADWVRTSYAAGHDHREGRRGAGVQRDQARQEEARRSSGETTASHGRGCPLTGHGWLRASAPSSCSARWSAPSCCSCRDGRVRVPRGVAVVPAQRLCLVRRRRQRRPPDRGDLHLGQPPPGAGLHVPRLAADLEHASWSPASAAVL